MWSFSTLNIAIRNIAILEPINFLLLTMKRFIPINYHKSRSSAVNYIIYIIYNGAEISHWHINIKIFGKFFKFLRIFLYFFSESMI